VCDRAGEPVEPVALPLVIARFRALFDRDDPPPSLASLRELADPEPGRERRPVGSRQPALQRLNARVVFSCRVQLPVDPTYEIRGGPPVDLRPNERVPVCAAQRRVPPVHVPYLPGPVHDVDGVVARLGDRPQLL